MPVKIFIRAGWALLMLLSLFFIYNNALRYFNFSPSGYTDYLQLRPFAGVLIVHIISGMIALLAGPLQFIAAIRKKHVKFHRSIGRIYMGCILVGGTSGLYLAVAHAILTVHYVTFGAGLAGLAIAWLLTSGMGLNAVRNRNFIQHREWMIRSYTVTCAFTTFRFLFGIIEKVIPINEIDALNICSWASWALPLLIVEAVLQSKKTTTVMSRTAITNYNELIQ